MNERTVRRYEDGLFFWEPTPLAAECRVDVFVDGLRRASVMGSPFQLDFLAVGFLFGEGLIGGPGDIKHLSVDGLKVRVELNRAISTMQALSSKNVETEDPLDTAVFFPKIGAAEVIALTEEFNSRSYLFRQTGAVHSCCLIDGPKRYYADDVARHNALDKVIGQYLVEGRSGRPALVLVTGRISTEILIKSAKAGLGLVISRSAVTDRAIELARRLNLIMIGFSRDHRFNVYHGGERIV